MEKSNTADREIIITRLLKAPRELVFEAWTKPEHVAQWWGPDGFTTTVHSMDVRVGGTLKMTYHGMGVNYLNVLHYTEVTKPERLCYIHGSGEENDPGEFEVTVTFEEEGNNTRLTMRSLFKTAEARNFVINEYGAIERGNETINHLEEHLAKMQGPAGDRN